MRRISLLILIGAALAAGWLWLVPVGPRSASFVEIAPGASTAQIGALLERHGLIRSRFAFYAMRVTRRGTLKAGEYRFDHPARLGEVYSRLERGDVFTISVTVPEGANMFDIADRLQAAHLVNREAFLKAVTAQAGLVKDLDPAAPSLEGYLFPDTYPFPRVVTPTQVVAAMVRRFRRAAAGIGLDLPANRRKLHQVVTMASLVERETPISEERPLVASVFVNRLERGIPLMTDPSVIYAALLEGRYRGAIFRSDLAADSPYNTYKHASLPPGPICNPGLASLQAAMSPARTDYLYFVAATADPSGHSRFSSSLEEHAQNVRAYRRSLPEAAPPPAVNHVRRALRRRK